MLMVGVLEVWDVFGSRFSLIVGRMGVLGFLGLMKLGIYTSHEICCCLIIC